jgi:ribosomal protein L20
MNKIKAISIPEGTGDYIHQVTPLIEAEYDIDPNFMAAYLFCPDRDNLGSIHQTFLNLNKTLNIKDPNLPPESAAQIISLGTNQNSALLTSYPTISDGYHHSYGSFPALAFLLPPNIQQILINKKRDNRNRYLVNLPNIISKSKQNLNAHKTLVEAGWLCIQNTPTDEIAQTRSAQDWWEASNDATSVTYGSECRPYLNYVKMNQVGNYASKPVFSALVNDFYEAFQHDVFVLKDFNYFYQPFKNKISLSNSSRNTYRLTQNFGKYTPNIGVTCDISSINYELMDKIAASSLKRIKVIEVPGWSRKVDNPKLTITTYTKSQVAKRKACLIPTLFKIQYRDEDYVLKDGWMFSLTLNTKLQVSSINNVIAINTMIDTLFIADGLKYINPEKYSAQIYAKIGKLSLYSRSLYASIPDTDIQTLRASLETKKELTLPDNAKYSALTKTLNVNSTIKANYDAISNKLEETKKSIRERIELNYNTLYNIKYALAQYKAALIALNSNKSTFQNSINEEHLSSINNNVKFFRGISSKAKDYEKLYKQEINRSIEDQDYTYDAFFENLANENVYVNSIICKLNNTLYSLDNKAEFDEFIAMKSSDNFSIQKLSLSITKPQKIKVDNDPNKIVVGGPYQLDYSISDNNLYIKLLNLPAVFGFNATALTYHVHPHAQSLSRVNSILEQQHKCCLGEASAMVHKAATTGNIKILIYSILIWVRSANSADPWGRNYIYFPKLEDVNLDGYSSLVEDLPLKDTITTDDDVESFLESIVNPQEEEEEEEEEDTLDAPEATLIPAIPAVTYNRYTTF